MSPDEQGLNGIGKLLFGALIAVGFGLWLLYRAIF